MHELLDGARRRLVHHFQPRGNDAGRDDRRHRRAGLLDIVEGRQRDLRQLRLGHSLTVISVMTASRPSQPVMSASRS